MNAPELEWMERASCKGFPTGWWFPHPTENAIEAKQNEVTR